MKQIVVELSMGRKLRIYDCGYGHAHTSAEIAEGCEQARARRSARREQRENLRSKLTARERSLLLFLEDHTAKEASVQFDVSTTRIYQIRKKARAKIGLEGCST